MQDSIIIWVEPNYANTPWCRQLFEGVKSELARFRRKAKFIISKEPESRPYSSGVLILAGETDGWINRMLEVAQSAYTRICLACADPAPDVPFASMVTLNRWGDMCQMMRYFHSANRRRIALYGVNPAFPADQKRIAGYIDMIRTLDLPVSGDDIYMTLGNVQDCLSELLVNIERYDAIIAGNDLYAVYMLPRLKKLGIKVPDHLFVAGFGNTYLSRITKPSLTTAALDHVELGRQVIRMVFNLEKNPHVTRMAVTVESQFYARESTAGIPISTLPLILEPSPKTNDISSYVDPCLSQVVNLELCLNGCDEIDRTIIEEILKEQTIESIAESLFISQSTLNYRLNKLYRQAGVSSRQELEDLINTYAPSFKAEALKTCLHRQCPGV